MQNQIEDVVQKSTLMWKVIYGLKTVLLKEEMMKWRRKRKRRKRNKKKRKRNKKKKRKRKRRRRIQRRLTRK